MTAVRLRLIGSTARRFRYRKNSTGLGALRRHLADPGSPLSPSVISPARFHCLYPTTGSASNLIMARYRNPFEKSNISFLGPGTFFCPWPVRYMVWLSLVPPMSPFYPLRLQPTCRRPTSNSRPSRTCAYAPPRMPFKSSLLSRATFSPC